MSHRVKRMQLFEDSVNNPEEFKKGDAVHDIKKLNLLQIFTPFEKKKFKADTDIIFHQWLMEAQKHGVDISEEHNRFIALQHKAFESIKKLNSTNEFLILRFSKLPIYNSLLIQKLRTMAELLILLNITQIT